MNYPGIDYHKRYSVACTLDAQGRKLHEAKIEHNAPAAFAAYFKKLGELSEVVIEACWNWGVLYDLLEETPGVAKVVLSHPAKNRIIADAQIKNDRIGRFEGAVSRGSGRVLLVLDSEIRSRLR